MTAQPNAPTQAQTSPSLLHVFELRRYPVKSLHGERCATAELTEDGVSGDRDLHVRGDRGLLTGRTRHQLLTLRASTDTTGHILVDGHPWDSPTAADLVRATAGDDAGLVAHSGPERVDVLPILVATDAEIERLDVDGRRLRPNITIAGTTPGQERTWPGQRIRIGFDVVLGVDSVRLRCVVTTINPDTGSQNLDILRRLHHNFDSRIALNCWVISGGTIRSTDPVVIAPMPNDAANTHPGYDSWIAGNVPYGR